MPTKLSILRTLVLLILAALPLAGAFGTAGIDVSAATANGGLDVHVRSATNDSPVVVVVTHEDPIAGTVIDRVVTLNASTAADASLHLSELRAGANFTVRVLNASIALPALPDLDDLLNLSALLGHTPIAQVDVPEIAPAALSFEHTTLAYHVGHRGSISSSDLPSTLVTQDGFIVIAWWEAPSSREGPGPGVLEAQVSRDGGHTFSAPILFFPTPESLGASWGMSESNDGQVGFFATNWNSSAGPGPTLTSSLDLRSLQQSPAVEFIAGNLSVRPSSGQVRWGDGFLTTVKDLVDKGVPSTQVLGAGTLYPGISFVRVDANGSASRMQTVNATSIGDAPITGPIQSVANGASAGAVWLTGEYDNVTGLWWSRAVDGATFAEPQRVPGIPRSHVEMKASQMDDEGTMHVTLEVRRDPLAAFHFDSYYVRIPTMGPPTVVKLNALTPLPFGSSRDNAMAPSIAVHDARVWVGWHGHSDDMGEESSFVAESTNHGMLFAPPYRVKVNSTDAALGTRFIALSLFPDGRPLVTYTGPGVIENGGPLVSQTFVAPLFDPHPRPDLAVAPRTPAMATSGTIGIIVPPPVHDGTPGVWMPAEPDLGGPITLVAEDPNANVEGTPRTLEVPGSPALVAVGLSVITLATFRRHRTR